MGGSKHCVLAILPVVPGKAVEQARSAVQKPLMKRCANGASSSKSGVSLGNNPDTIQQLNLEHGGFLSDIQDKDATEKVEAIIKSIVDKEMMCTSAASQQEQIHRKQQILEELQKVERELKGKAQSQYKLDQHALAKSKSQSSPKE